MKRLLLLFFIIALVFPIVAHSRDFGPELDVEARALPGGFGYFWQRLGEWFSVNIFTAATKAKQEKYLELASLRLAEVIALSRRGDYDSHFVRAGRSYEDTLIQAEDMAEKIIFLDGAEIKLAEDVEEASRLHEEVIVSLLKNAPAIQRPSFFQALAAARIINDQIYTYMVEKYQITDNDVEKHLKILSEHLEIVERERVDYASLLQGKPEQQIKQLLAEVQKFQKAGLALPAFQRINLIKNIIYAKLVAQN